MSPGPVRVLIVEDNDDLAEVLGEALTLLRADVHVARTMEEGLVRYRAVRPHLALVDLRLPRGSGLDLARAVSAESSRRCLLVAITGLAAATVEARALGAGFDRLLLKPFDLADVERLLAESRAHADG